MNQLARACLLCLLLLAGCAHHGPKGVSPVSPTTKLTTETVVRLELQNPPVLGSSRAGQMIHLGGFSGLRYLGRSKEGRMRFLTHTDRGPNTDETLTKSGLERPFLLPHFTPRLIFLEADLEAGKLFVVQELLLKRPDGKPLTGLPPLQAGAEQAVDIHGGQLLQDPYGMDLEGIALGKEGSYWMVDEYGPSVARFSREGQLLEVLRPGNGLPKIFEQRRMNRGFEGVAVNGRHLYAVLQSPLDNPRSEEEESSKRSRVTRIVEIDLEQGRTLAQYALLLDEAGSGKVSDLAWEASGKLVALEQGKATKYAYRLDLDEATNLQLLPEKVAGPGGTLEQLGPVELLAAGVVPVRKTEVIDLAALGVTEEKPEGVDIVEGKYLAVITDNDFALAGGLDRKSGRAEEKHEGSVLYLVPLSLWKPLR